VAIDQQLRCLPRTLFAIYRIVREDYSISALDENLWVFRAFHDRVNDPHYGARRWEKARLASVQPSDVIGLPVGELALMFGVAMEIEEPILEYSRENGEGFRALLPALARFMGRNRDEAAEAEAQGRPWCESPWCAEERRHANTFARLIERLTARAPDRGNPNVPRVADGTEAVARQMLVSREAAEWNSSSTYCVMAAHSKAALHTLVRNIARDEIKHLGVLSAASLYLFGPHPWRRFVTLIRHSLKEYSGHKRNRTQGERMGANRVTAFEVMMAHLMSEWRIRSWLRSLPARTLAWAFEFDNGPSADARRALARWDTTARQRALATFDSKDSRRRDGQIRHNRYAMASRVGQSPDGKRTARSDCAE
jgi:hypothetical protein